MRIDFEMPLVRQPFPSCIHPGLLQLEEHLNRWVRRYDLARTPASWDRYTRAHFPELVARGFSRVKDLTMIGEWYNFLWFWDDQLDDGPPLRNPAQLDQVIEGLIAMLPVRLDATPNPATGLGAAIGDLWMRMAPPMSPAWRQRFADRARDYLASYTTPLAMQRNKPAPDMATYVTFRRVSGAMGTVYPLLEAVETLEISNEVSSLPEFVAFLNAANDVTVWTNDIASARKELAHGETTNFVAVIQQQEDCSWQRAADRAAEMISDRLDEYLALAQKIVATVEAILVVERDELLRIQHYVELVTGWLSGSRDWHLQSSRYRDVEYLAPGKRHEYLDVLLPLERIV